MSSFEITGTVLSASEKTSAKGNAYFVFQLQDAGKQTFDMSLFGSGMSHCEKVVPGKKITVKGTLQSREYTDKSGVVRFNTSLQPQWIESTGKPASAARAVAPSAENSDLDELPF
jgi:single-stranded DNA-binding protein